MSSMHVSAQAASPEGLNHYMKILAADGHEFLILRDLATTSSRKIVDMLDNPGPHPGRDLLRLPYPSHVVHKVCTYILYKERYTNSKEEIPDFNVNPQEALTLLDAATYLEL